MLRHLVSSAKKKKICQTDRILNSNVSHIKMCKYFSSNAFRIFSICVFQRIYLHRHYYTTKLIKYIISLFFFEGFPNFWKIIDPLNFIIIGFRMQFVELKIDISSDNSSCWLRHPKVVLVYFTLPWLEGTLRSGNFNYSLHINLFLNPPQLITNTTFCSVYKLFSTSPMSLSNRRIPPAFNNSE